MNKVSVLLTFYNEDPHFFAVAIESILNQTYSDFQFVIVNDNPSNRILDSMAESYALKDNRIYYIKNSENLGLTKSLNKGLLHCEGYYVARMDADDIAMPSRLEKQVRFMDDNPNIIASGGNAYVIDENDVVIGEMKRPESHFELVSLAPFISPIFHPAAIIRRVFGKEKWMYNDRYRYSQDYDLWNLLMFKGNLGNLPDYLIKYRKSGNQISSIHRNEQKMIDSLIMANSIKKLFRGIDEDQIDILVSLCGYAKDNGSLCYSDVELTFSCLYKENQSNRLVDINITISYLLNKYCEFLGSNYSFVFSANRIRIITSRLKAKALYLYLILVRMYLSKLLKRHPSIYGFCKSIIIYLNKEYVRKSEK